MHMNDDIWISIESNLLDCRETLDELAALVEEVKKNPSSSRNIFRKPNVMLRLSLRKKEMVEFQDKIGKSNASMQTAVGVVSLSLALRQNVSQEMLMGELQRLRGLVENTQRVARSSGTNYPAAARMSRNIEGLVAVARRFHSNASSTASTRYGGNRRRGQSSWLGSDAGELTDYERDRIRNWTSGLGQIDEVTDTASTVDTRTTERTGTTSTGGDRSTDVTTPDLEEDDDDDDQELDLEIFQNAEELGRMSFAKREYDNAEKFLNKAMSGATGTSSDAGHFENLKLQLSICYCFQAKWQAAEKVLLTLGKKKRKSDLPVFHLLHAVALAHLADEKYDSAYSACKRSLQGKKKAQGGKTSQDYIDSLALLAAICEVRGEPIEAAAIRHSIPSNRMQEGFPEPEEFIWNHASIIDEAFGKGFSAGGKGVGRVVDEAEDDGASEVVEVDEDDEAERREQDTGKEVGGGDLEASLPSRVSGWDTGKEILSMPQGGYITENPILHKRIFSTEDVYDEQTGKILAWADWDSCEWIDLKIYWGQFGESMIYDLIVDEDVRQDFGFPRLGHPMKDEDKHSDLLVVDIERMNDAVQGMDSHKEVYFDAPVPEPSRSPDIYTPGPPGPPRFSQAFNSALWPHDRSLFRPSYPPIPEGVTPVLHSPNEPLRSGGQLGIKPSDLYSYGSSSSPFDQPTEDTQPDLPRTPSINTTFADDLTSNVYISEPRGGGVTSAPPLHTHQNNTFLSPMTPPPRPAHHPSRSVDALPRALASNNPFRRAASQRSPNNPTLTRTPSQAQSVRHMASFETTVYQYVPPPPWTTRRYGNTREAPRILQTPAIFLRDVPDGRTDGLVLGVNLGLETIEVTVALHDGTLAKCPGTLYLNHSSKSSSDLPWFDCLPTNVNPSSPPPPRSPTAPTTPSLPSFPVSSSKDSLFTLTTHPYSLLHLLQLHALQSQSSLETSPPTTPSLPLPSLATTPAIATALGQALNRLSVGVSRWLETRNSAFHLPWAPLDEIIFSVPDVLLSLPSAKAKILDIISKNELFAHAKVTPASLSVVWWFLKKWEGDILFGLGTGGGRSLGVRRRVEVVVVRGGELMVEMGRYEVVSENGAVIVRPAGDGGRALVGYVFFSLLLAILPFCCSSLNPFCYISELF
jgi:hypothetical protein